jgi:hypothetical protein
MLNLFQNPVLNPQSGGELDPETSSQVTTVLFFSNRLGCAGSLLVTALGTLLVLWLTGLLRI